MAPALLDNVLDVRLRFDELDARRLEAGVFEHEQLVGPRVAKCPQDGVTFAHEEPAARFEQLAYGGCPALDAGQPAQGADPGVDDIETSAAKLRGGVVNLRFDVRNLRATIAGQLACNAESRLDSSSSG
jgi:hypothetical protein